MYAAGVTAGSAGSRCRFLKKISLEITKYLKATNVQFTMQQCRRFLDYVPEIPLLLLSSANSTPETVVSKCGDYQ